jgi:hypothetical protein
MGTDNIEDIRHMKKNTHLPSERNTQLINRASLLLVIFAFAWFGSSFIRSTLAATPTATLTPADGSITGNAKVVTVNNGTTDKAVVFGPSATTSSVCQQMAIPAYFDPTWSGNPWAAATANAPGVGIMIADLANGPGTSVNPDYPAAFAAAKAAGIRVLGYVDTAYGNDSLASVESQVNEWRDLYGITDIFFDEASAVASEENYYQTLTAYVHSQTSGSITMINPGTVPDQSYVNAADIISIFEGNYTTYLSTTFPAWVHEYPPTKFFNVIYSVPNNQTAMTQAIDQAEQNNAGYVFATDAGPPNPYDVEPSFLNSEATQVRSNCNV